MDEFESDEEDLSLQDEINNLVEVVKKYSKMENTPKNVQEIQQEFSKYPRNKVEFSIRKTLQDYLLSSQDELPLIDKIISINYELSCSSFLSPKFPLVLITDLIESSGHKTHERHFQVHMETQFDKILTLIGLEEGGKDKKSPKKTSLQLLYVCNGLFQSADIIDQNNLKLRILLFLSNTHGLFDRSGLNLRFLTSSTELPSFEDCVIDETTEEEDENEMISNYKNFWKFQNVVNNFKVFLDKVKFSEFIQEVQQIISMFQKFNVKSLFSNFILHCKYLVGLDIFKYHIHDGYFQNSILIQILLSTNRLLNVVHVVKKEGIPATNMISKPQKSKLLQIQENVMKLIRRNFDRDVPGTDPNRLIRGEHIVKILNLIMKRENVWIKWKQGDGKKTKSRCKKLVYLKKLQNSKIAENLKKEEFVYNEKLSNFMLPNPINPQVMTLDNNFIMPEYEMEDGLAHKTTEKYFESMNKSLFSQKNEKELIFDEKKLNPVDKWKVKRLLAKQDLIQTSQNSYKPVEHLFNVFFHPQRVVKEQNLPKSDTSNPSDPDIDIIDENFVPPEMNVEELPPEPPKEVQKVKREIKVQPKKESLPPKRKKKAISKKSTTRSSVKKESTSVVSKQSKREIRRIVQKNTTGLKKTGRGPPRSVKTTSKIKTSYRAPIVDGRKVERRVNMNNDPYLSQIETTRLKQVAGSRSRVGSSSSSSSESKHSKGYRKATENPKRIDKGGEKRITGMKRQRSSSNRGSPPSSKRRKKTPDFKISSNNSGNRSVTYSRSSASSGSGGRVVSSSVASQRGRNRNGSHKIEIKRSSRYNENRDPSSSRSRSMKSDSERSGRHENISNRRSHDNRREHRGDRGHYGGRSGRQNY